MKYKLKLVTKADSDFKRLKKDGFGGAIFSPQTVTQENLLSAKENGVKRFVHIGNMTRIRCEYAEADGIKSGEIFAATREILEKTLGQLENLMPLIDGFIIPLPCASGLLWDASFPDKYKSFCGKNLYDEIPFLFDRDTHYADIRIWYYINVAEKLFSEFLTPIYSYIKASGKIGCFDLGCCERGDYLVNKQVLPSLFNKAKVPVICEEKGERYFITPMHNKNAETLFVEPMRYIMGMYVWGNKVSKEESELSLAVCEGQYYRNSLEKCGIKAYIIDDFTLADMRINSLKRFQNILLANGCMIEESKKEKLLNIGVKIDDIELMRKLDEVNQE